MRSQQSWDALYERRQQDQKETKEKGPDGSTVSFFAVARLRGCALRKKAASLRVRTHPYAEERREEKQKRDRSQRLRVFVLAPSQRPAPSRLRAGAFAAASSCWRLRSGQRLRFFTAAFALASSRPASLRWRLRAAHLGHT